MIFARKSIGFWSENDKSSVPKVIKKLIIICSILNRSFYELCRHAGCHLRSVRGPSFSQGRQGMSQVWLGQSNAPTRVFTGSRFGALSYCSFLLCGCTQAHAGVRGHTVVVYAGCARDVRGRTRCTALMELMRNVDDKNHRRMHTQNLHLSCP